jgi:hypothetical protein
MDVKSFITLDPGQTVWPYLKTRKHINSGPYSKILFFQGNMNKLIHFLQQGVIDIKLFFLQLTLLKNKLARFQLGLSKKPFTLGEFFS